MRRDPESVGLTPDGDATVEIAPAREAPGCPLRAAVTTPALWLLGATFTARIPARPAEGRAQKAKGTREKAEQEQETE